MSSEKVKIRIMDLNILLFDSSTKLYAVLSSQFLTLFLQNYDYTESASSCHSVWSRNMVTHLTTIEKYRCIWSVVFASHTTNFLYTLLFWIRYPLAFLARMNNRGCYWNASGGIRRLHSSCWAINGCSIMKLTFSCPLPRLHPLTAAIYIHWCNSDKWRHDIISFSGRRSSHRRKHLFGRMYFLFNLFAYASYQSINLSVAMKPTDNFIL